MSKAPGPGPLSPYRTGRLASRCQKEAHVIAGYIRLVILCYALRVEGLELAHGAIKSECWFLVSIA